MAALPQMVGAIAIHEITAISCKITRKSAFGAWQSVRYAFTKGSHAFHAMKTISCVNIFA